MKSSAEKKETQMVLMTIWVLCFVIVKDSVLQ